MQKAMTIVYQNLCESWSVGCNLPCWPKYLLENSIFILKIQNGILFSIFKVLFKSILANTGNL